MNGILRFVRREFRFARQRVNRNVRRVRAAVRERLQRFVLGLIEDRVIELADLVARTKNEELREEIEGQIESAESDRDDELDRWISGALENYDFGDAIGTALGDYDFSDDIETALANRDGPDNPAERLAELFRGMANELESDNGPKPKRRR